jgi:hypothetical protein
MKKYGGQFERTVRIGVVDNILRPTYVGQTLTDWDTGETLHYDTTMDSAYVSKLLKKYTRWFRNLFSSTRSRFADDIANRRGGQDGL